MALIIPRRYFSVKSDSLLGSYDTAGETQDVQIVASLAYLADGTGGLVVVDVSDPANITLVDDVDTPDDARGLYVDGDLVYLADSGAGLQIAAAVGAATQMTINAGDGQTPVAGEAVAIAPSVIARDANGNPVAGVDVTFAVASGGEVDPTTPVITDANGVAAVTSWVLGSAAGINTLTASVAGIAEPASFTATGIQASPIPALGPWALLMLLLVMFGAALPALLRRGGA